MAELEYTIQTSTDKDAVDKAKGKMVQAQQAADLELEEMIMLDEMVQKYLLEKSFEF